MNPDFDDPNNHVPAVSPEDAWDGLDEVSEGARMGLPAKRVEPGLPPKKERIMPRVNRHSPSLKVEREGQYNPIRPSDSDSAGGAEAEAEVAAEVETAAPAAAKASRKASRKPVKKRGAKGLPPVVPNPETEEPGESRVTLPDAQPAKRLRVKEIGATNDGSPARPEKMVLAAPAVATGGENKVEVQKRRRFNRGERSEWGSGDGRGSLKWMIFTGLGVVVLVILSVALSQLPDGKQSRSDSEPIYRQLAPREDENRDVSDDMKDLELLTNSQDRAKSIFAEYACAKATEDFIGLVHAPERNRQVIEENWKPLGMKPGWVPGDGTLWTVLDRDGIRYAVLEGILSDFTSFRAYFRQDGVDLRIDWKATAGYSTADFAEMKKGKGNGREVRATISIADFYTFAFPEEKHRNYRVMSVDGEANLWGYVPLGTALDEELLNLFLPSQVTGEAQTEIQVTLRLEPGLAESLPDQWIIAGIVRLTWLDE